MHRLRALPKQLGHRFAVAVGRHIERTFFDVEGRLGTDAQRRDDRGMQVGDRDRVLRRDQRPLVGRFAVKESLFHAAAKH